MTAATEPMSGRHRPLADGVLHAYCLGCLPQLNSIKPEWEAAHPHPQAALAQVADHIDHVRQVAGVEHVGLGGDFDGTPDVSVGLEDVSAYPALFAELLARGWTEPECAALAGGNLLRALRAAESAAAG